MTNRTFAEYKQDMRDYVLQYAREQQGQAVAGQKTTTEMNIREITDGLNRNFPKQATLGDHLAMCYAYGHLSFLPLSPDDHAVWRKHIKAYINKAPTEKFENDCNMLFMMRELSMCEGEPAEKYRYAEKALRKITLRNRKHPRVVDLMGKIARPYYDEQLQKAGNSKNFDSYDKQIKGYDKVFNILLNLPVNSRYPEFHKLTDKMRSLYNESEWGRVEWGHKISSFKRRIFKSLPEENKIAIRSRRTQDEWLYK